VRLNHTAGHMEKYDRYDIMPVVVIRDFFQWMQSMVRCVYTVRI